MILSKLYYIMSENSGFKRSFCEKSSFGPSGHDVNCSWICREFTGTSGIC